MSKSEYIRDLRSFLSQTMEEFARDLGVSYTTIYRWEHGLNEPSPLAWRVIQRWAAIHGFEQKISV